MKTFTAKEVNEISEKLLEEISGLDTNQYQIDLIRYGFVLLFGELTLAQFELGKYKPNGIPEDLREDDDETA